MKEAVSLEIRNDLNELRRVYAEIEKLQTEFEISADALYNLQLAVEEVLTNIISYAFKDDLEHQISLRITPKTDLITIQIEDDGAAFDPTSVQDPDLDEDLESRKIGGLGLFLVKNVMRSVSYSREADKNILQMEIEKDLTD